MNAPLLRSSLLPADGMGPLLHSKEQIQQEAVGKVPELLVQVTVQAVVRLKRKETPKRVLKPGVHVLARQVLKELAGKKWKPTDTLVLLQQQPAVGPRRREHGEPHR
jgi:hypothetical protein